MIKYNTTDGKQHPTKTYCPVIRANVEESSSSETMVSNYQTFKYHNPKDCNMNLEN